MSAVIQNIQLACAVCKIGLYRVFCRICGRGPPPPRPEFNPVCIGLTEAGKTTLLSLVAGHSVNDIKPTTGFEIKSCQFKRCILNMKEIGGSEKVRPFWKHYYKGADGVIFVVDSACSEEDMETVHQALHTALDDPQLRGKPCVILCSWQDKDGTRTKKELIEALDVDVLQQERQLALHLCSKRNIESIREGMELLNNFLLGTEEEELEGAEPQKPEEINRL